LRGRRSCDRKQYRKRGAHGAPRPATLTSMQQENSQRFRD
jgi:hypothetical protein